MYVDGSKRSYLACLICVRLLVILVIPYEVAMYTGDVNEAGCDCDVSLKLFGTDGSSSEHLIKKADGNFERASIDRFQVMSIFVFFLRRSFDNTGTCTCILV
jgi:hypothetical protein